jgi:hypothetical protein
MPIPSGYSRSTFSGHLRNGEEFAWSVWCDEAPSDQAATQSQADAFANDFNVAAATTGNPNALIDSDSGYDTVTVYSYLTSSGRATHIAEASIARAGTGSSGVLPNQAALVVTLLTDNAGRRSRGRVYLPCNGLDLATGQAAGGTVTNVATWFANFLTALNGDLGDQHVVVLSQVGEVSTPITSTRVDSKIDTQRRRSKSETVLSKSSHAVTHP